MDYPVQALTDAATIYAAGRFIANDYEGGIGHYLRMDDEIYYYEFLHNIVLYDHIIYDNSSLETATGNEILPLIKAVNDACDEQVIFVDSIGIRSSPNLSFMQVGLCQLLRELVEADPMRKERLANVHVPWAYRKRCSEALL
jgi:hypothetical protein